MTSAFDYKVMPDWPVLSWLAICRPGTNCVLVLHGAEVETRPGWFCEAVWDGDFEEANFDRSDLVFGSGGKCRNGNVSFVSSGATVDRLQYLERKSCTLISNSLACLIAAAGVDPDPTFRGYKNLFSSIRDGLAMFKRRVPLSSGYARLVYHKNATWDNCEMREVPKFVLARDFSSYEKYIAFLCKSLKLIAANMSSVDRRYPYEWQGTLSRGYDSPTAVALAQAAGLRSVLSFHQSRPGIKDDGLRIAEALGVDIEVIDRLSWQRSGVWEPYFISADGQGKEVFLSSARERLRRRVLVTGFGGDHVWAKKPKSLSPDLVRGDHSGLSLTEFRLHYGFINLALPFMGMNQVAEIGRISQSPAMSYWDIGGKYTRPIPRRVLEERGVARSLFGMVKTGTSMRYVVGHDPWSANGYRAYRRWIWQSPKLPANRFTRIVWLSALTTFRRLLLIGDLAPHTAGRVTRTFVRCCVFVLAKLGYEDHAFLWGIECACRSYYGDDRYLERVCQSRDNTR